MKLNYLTLVFAVLTLSVQGQTIEKSGVRKYGPRSTGNIYENNTIAGYYLFYEAEKVDRKSTAYTVEFFDNNLNSAMDFEVVKSDKVRLLESVYNQSAFLMMFYEDGDLEFVTYDKAGKVLGSKKATDISKWEKARISQSLLDPEAENTTFFPLSSDGFVRQTYSKGDKLGFQIEAYNNDMSSKWSYGSSPKSDLIEGAEIMYASGKYIVCAVGKKKTLMTKKFDTFFVILDAATGKEMCNIPVKDANNAQMSMLNCFVDEEKGEVLILGEYYLPGDDVLKDNSLGVYARKVDLTGKDINLEKYGWAREIANMKKTNKTGDDDEKGKTYVWFHKFVQSANGSIFAVGEQYKKQASALGIAANVLNGGAGSGVSNVEIKITNLVSMELGSDLKLKSWEVTPKQLSRISLPEGYGYASPQMLAAYMKARGFFDYQFTSSNPAKDKYQFVYTDLNRKEEKGEKADLMIGVISVDAGVKSFQRIPINSEARAVSVYAAKPGFILISEYFRKEKKLTLRLEKITY